MHKIELLSPAGSFDALKAAVNNGADAVYLGGANFSARAFAQNFDHEEMLSAIKYCHLRGVKLYVTLNTLLTENELENALNEARFYHDNNVDALIIQDLGLYYRLKKELPDLDLHASTQMHIHNIQGVENARKLGFKKVVLARESSLELIKEACKKDIEIECFIHGAICVSYSGQCLMSSVSKDRSANKGMCAQCCRLRYDLFDETKKEYVKTDTKYLLSPKDMFLLEDIPDLIKAGVSSLKIEGRMKSPAYVGLVTSLYRRAIDAYYDGKEFHISGKEYDELLSVFNRGFTNTYLKNDDNDLFGNIRPNHMGKPIGKVIDHKNNSVSIELCDQVKQFDGIRILNEKEDSGKILNTLSVNGKYVSSADKGDIISISLNGPVRKGDVVIKTLDHELENRITGKEDKKRPIDLYLRFKDNENVLIKALLADDVYEKEYDLIPDSARNAPLSKDDLLKQFSKTGDSPFYVNDANIDIGRIFMPKSKINEIRRDFYSSFEEHLLNGFKRLHDLKVKFGQINEENTEDDVLVEMKNDESTDLNLLKHDPVINEKGIYAYPSVCAEFGNILSDSEDKTAYYTMNVCNSYAYELLNRLGFSKIILSSELTDKQIYSLIDAYKRRNGSDIRPYVLVYGKRSLMYIKRDPFKGYIKDDDLYSLSGGHLKYAIRHGVGAIELIEDNALKNTSIDLKKVRPFLLLENEDIKVITNAFSIDPKAIFKKDIMV